MLPACHDPSENPKPTEVGFAVNISGHDGYELGMSSGDAADVKLDYRYQPCGEYAGCYVSPTEYLHHPALLQVVEDTRRRQIRQIRLHFDQQLAVACDVLFNNISQHLNNHYGPSQAIANQSLRWLPTNQGYVQLQQRCQDQTNGQVLLLLSLDRPTTH